MGLHRFKETGHPVFKETGHPGALSRGILKRKKCEETTHFNGDSSNTELLFRIIIHSANQLSIYGPRGELVSKIRFDR